MDNIALTEGTIFLSSFFVSVGGFVPVFKSHF